MKKNSSEYLKVGVSKLCKILMVLGILFLAIIIILCLSLAIPKGLSKAQVMRYGLIFLWALFYIWFILNILFITVTATKRGIESDNLFGRHKLFLWEEIVEVRRPMMSKFHQLTYVISKNNEKLLLLRTFNNYEELIRLIKEKAQNIKKCNS
jgi:hypothetical protein